MTNKTKELVAAGHALASELKAECGAVDIPSNFCLGNRENN